MFVAVSVFEIHIAESRSLKGKRMVVRSLRDRIRRLGVSCAEVAFQELHQRSRLAVAAVSADEATLERLVDTVIELVEAEGEAVLTGWTREILPFDERVDLGVADVKYS